MTRFDKLQRQIDAARKNAKTAAKDLCKAVVQSNGQLSCALQGPKNPEPLKK